jgi:predicted ATP-grasp superfamily ATP-dependent carboligase
MWAREDLFDFKDEPPELERPFLVVHLAGWTDSGVAGQTAMGFLEARWNTETIGSFASDELIDYRARRPLIRLASGTIEAVTWSDVELSRGTTVNGLRDALLLTGPEPDFRWHAFADRVVELCRQLGVTEVFGLGAFPAPSLHTDPVAVVSTSADPELAGRLETVPAIVELAAGIQSVLEERLHKAGIPATGLWARVPPYLAGGSHPPAALALVRIVERLAGVTVDATELEAATKEHIEQVEQAIRERPQIAEFVEQIRSMVEQGNEQRLPSGEELADELERFLSQQPPPDDDNRSF